MGALFLFDFPKALVVTPYNKFCPKKRTFFLNYLPLPSISIILHIVGYDLNCSGAPTGNS